MKVLAVCHDIGGAQVLLQVIKELKRKPGIHIKIVVGHFAHKIFSRFSPYLAYEDWSLGQANRVFTEFSPDLLLTSTSWKSSLEQQFRNIANRLDIPSVVLMDFWSNYRLRWQHATYPFESSKEHVCVMDALMARSLRNEGYPQKNIYITGHPHLEKYTTSTRLKSRSKSTSKHINALFLSTPLSALGLNIDSIAPIRTICEGLSLYHRSIRKPIKLSIRLHPHEKPDKSFIEDLQKLSTTSITVRLTSNTLPLKRQINTHDLILGYLTMALFEARCLNKKAVAIKVTHYPSDLTSAIKSAGIQLIPLNTQRIADTLQRRQTLSKTTPRDLNKGACLAIAKLCFQLLSKKVI